MEYRTGFYRVDSRSGINVLRVRMPLFRSVKINLALGHLLAPLALLIGGLRCAKAEAIYAYSPPLLIGLAGRLIAWKMKAVFVLGVQDLHPQAYIDQGIIKNPFFIHVLRGLEKWIYRLSDAITVHSLGNREHVLSATSLKKEHVRIVPNWVDETKVFPLPRRNSFSTELDFGEKFVIGYAGTIGLSQGAECIIDAAFSLRKKEEIHFLLVGGGIEKALLVEKTQEAGLDNITFLDMQTQEKYPYVVATFDVALVTLNSMVKTPVIPSKIISIMAAERPFIASLPEGDAADLVRLANCGLVVPPDAPEKLETAILHLFENPTVRERFGRNGRRYVEENLTVDNATVTIKEIFHAARQKRLGV